MNQAIMREAGNSSSIEAPLVSRTKAQVVRKGLELNVPYEMTWSRYEGGSMPCGVCGTWWTAWEAVLAEWEWKIR